jgi:hypothetical protein
MLTLDVQSVAALRAAIDHCNERGLSAASKWYATFESLARLEGGPDTFCTQGVRLTSICPRGVENCILGCETAVV